MIVFQLILYFYSPIAFLSVILQGLGLMISIKVQLYGDDKKVGEEVELNEGNAWTHTGVDGDLVAPEVRGHVEELVVVAEHQGEEGVLKVRGDERLELVLLRRAVEQAGVDTVRLSKNLLRLILLFVLLFHQLKD